jgi:nucleoside-diphosphate-sugar epimerase
MSVRCAVRNHLAAKATLGTQVDLVPVKQIDGDTDWSDALRGVDTVCHLAARAHVLEEKAADPLAAFLRVNAEGTRRLAESAASSGVRRLVLVSSIKVNGEASIEKPFAADDVPAPVDPYGVSKQRGEEHLKRICAAATMEGVVVRPPLVYGAGVGANFRKLMQLVASGVPLPLGSVSNRRSLVSVWNLCDLLFRVVQAPAAANRTFMVSDGRDLSTPELIRLIASAMNRPGRLVRVPLPMLRLAAKLSGQMAQYTRLCLPLTVDMNETQRILSWNPPHSVEESVWRTVHSFLNERKH